MSKANCPRSRCWIGTYNNPPMWQDDLLKFTTIATYVCGQLEKGKEGTLHLQFAVYAKNKLSLK